MIDMTTLFDVNKVAETIKQFDVTKIDLTKFDVRNLEMPKFDMPKFDMPKFDLPKFDLPKFDLPKFDLPKFDMPEVDMPAEVERVADFMRDATYAGIGAAVIVAQKVDAEVRKLVAKAS